MEALNPAIDCIRRGKENGGQGTTLARRPPSRNHPLRRTKTETPPKVEPKHEQSTGISVGAYYTITPQRRQWAEATYERAARRTANCAHKTQERRRGQGEARLRRSTLYALTSRRKPERHTRRPCKLPWSSCRPCKCQTRTHIARSRTSRSQRSRPSSQLAPCLWICRP